MMKNELMKIKENTSSEIKKWIIDDILNVNKDDEIVDYMKHVIEQGGIDGAISTLIYYNETSEFFHKFENEILDMLQQYVEKFGHIPVDILNAERLSWFSYESIVNCLICELGI